MKPVAFVSDLALDQLGVKTTQYATFGNIHHGKVVEPGPFTGLNLRQSEVSGQWVCDEPNPSQQAAFGKHFVKMNDGTMRVAGFFNQ